MAQRAIGLIETDSLVSAIAGADAAAKNAQITLVAAELNDGGLVTVRLEGELADVQVAVEAAATAIKQLRQTVSTHVIARPSEELTVMLKHTGFIGLSGGVSTPATQKATPPAKPPRQRKPVPPKPAAEPSPLSAKRETAPVVALVSREPTAESKVTTPAEAPDWPEIERMPVVKLRQYARSVKGLSLQGRQISMANKTQLLAALRKLLNP